MRRKLSIAMAAIAALMLCACSDRRTPPVPKPEAYPRIEDPGQRYAVVDSIPLHLEINSSATLTRPSATWLDISYPLWHATIHTTISHTSPDKIKSLIDNRAERIHLDLHGHQTVSENEINSPDFSSIIFSSPEARTTPLHFIASDGYNWIVSGTAVFYDVSPDAPVDSLAPAVDYLKRDLQHMLSTLTKTHAK